MSIHPDFPLMRRAFKQKCPRCHLGNLYKPGLSLDLQDHCSHCGLDFTRNDSADGPAVFLIFVLGFLMVPAALIVEFTLYPPLWVHAVIWPVIIVAMIVGSLRPLKSYIIALQYKYRPEDWD
jgi:uncharacterized protein (DUF983 family)